MNFRFRLVALTNNMDRSPSESSLEKIERSDVIEIGHHNAIVMQTKENAEIEKEQAVKEETEKCKLEWEQKMNAEISILKAKYEAEKQVRETFAFFSDKLSLGDRRPWTSITPVKPRVL